MSALSAHDLLLKLEDWRLHQHFKRVEMALRAWDVSHLSPALQQSREQALDQLHSYAARGIFPRNHEHAIYSPCFIDRDRRECAVANLVMVSGHTDLANHVAAVANYAYVPQMTFPELDDWARGAGLTREELARIQPGYYATFDGPFVTTAIAIWAAGMVTFLINVFLLARKRAEIAMPVIGLIVAVVPLLLGLYCLHSLWQAYYLGTHSDGYPYDRPLREVGPFAIATIISLLIALATGSVSIYRLRDWYNDLS